MPAAGWIVVGAMAGVASLRAALRIVASIRSDVVPVLVGRVAWFATGVFGAVTAWIASSASVPHAAVLSTVAILLVAQTPADLLVRRLSRPATLAAAAAVSAIVAVDALASGSPRTIVETSGWAAVIVAVYAALHRVSPRSLGWGDVLLVLPLGTAVAFVAVDRLAAWQLLAATSGAVHAVVRRTARGDSAIPFGPHLLGAAWVVVATSV